MGQVTVFGSANLDTVIHVENLPKPGETVLANGEPHTSVGGKGLNQAIAAVRSGAKTVFMGAVGDDEAGASLTTFLNSHGVIVDMQLVASISTGSAVVLIDNAGENSIVVTRGANSRLDKLDPRNLTHLNASRVVLFQAETPEAGLVAFASEAKGRGKYVIWNAAPVPKQIPKELLDAVDLLIVNESEAFEITRVLGQKCDKVTEALDFLSKFFPSTIITLGQAGVLYASLDGAVETCPALNVEAIDTSGAGDTFCGAVAAEISHGVPLSKAIKFAAAAAAVSVKREGAT